MSLSEKQIKLHQAVASYSEKTGVNGATMGVVTEKIVGLLASRWDTIVDIALIEENKGIVNVGFRVSFDMTHKTPVGKVVMGFTQTTKDECDFQVADPDQATLPFAQAVRSSASGTSPQAAPSNSTRTAPAILSSSATLSDSVSSPTPTSPESAAQPTARRSRRSRVDASQQRAVTDQANRDLASAA